MQKILYFSIFLFAYAFSSFGQNVLTYESNALLSGDKQDFVLFENFGEIDQGLGGYDITWDYSYFIPGDTLTSYMLDATKQQGHEHFPMANIAIREKEKVVFYNVSPEGMEDYGFVQSDITYKYELPIRRFSFPFVYGNKMEGTYTSEKIGFPETKRTGHYISEIDGFGTLILPGNVKIESVLRVRTSQIIDSTQIGYVVYRWYCQYSDPVLRYPLLSIIIREGTDNYCISKAAYYANANELVEKESSKIGFVPLVEFTTPEALMLNIKVYPNPFIEKVNVDYMLPSEAKVTIIVSDALGRVVETLVDKQQEPGIHSVEFKGKGYFFLYYVTTLVNGRVVSSKKLIHVNRW